MNARKTHALIRDLSVERSDKNAKISGMYDGMEGFLMKTGTNGIPAREGTAAGKEKCKLCMINNAGTIVETTSDIIVYNPFGTPISQDTYITVKVINGAQLVVDAEDCQ